MMTEPVSSPTAPPTARPRFRWRRLLQFRLRTLLILTTLLCIWFGWWSYMAKRQCDAVATLRERFDALVSYDFEEDGLDKPPYWPKWFVDAIGVDYFASVKVVIVSLKMTDEGLAHLQVLTGLQFLDLSDSQVTD